MRTKSQISGWPSAPQRHDQDLVERIQRQDSSAMGDLYDRYGKLAYTIILRIVPSEAVAENLLAETFVKIWNQIGRWKDARSEDLLLWLLLLARNHATEYLRSRNDPLPRALPRLTALTNPALLQEFPRPRSAEEFVKLRNAFSELSKRELHILELACFDGIPPNEIAVELGETLLAVKEAIKSALNHLSPVTERKDGVQDPVSST